jgi:hypothetical protein
MVTHWRLRRLDCGRTGSGCQFADCCQEAGETRVRRIGDFACADGDPKTAKRAETHRLTKQNAFVGDAGVKRP